MRPGSSEIAMFAVAVLEEFIARRGVEARDQIARGLRRSSKFRQAYRGSIVSAPQAVDHELRSLASRP